MIKSVLVSCGAGLPFRWIEYAPIIGIFLMVKSYVCYSFQLCEGGVIDIKKNIL